MRLCSNTRWKIAGKSKKNLKKFIVSSNNSRNSMQPNLKFIEELARGAGRILAAGYQREHQVKFKGVIDLVTETDHQSEAYLIGEIQAKFKGHYILAEESGETT